MSFLMIPIPSSPQVSITVTGRDVAGAIQEIAAICSGVASGGSGASSHQIIVLLFRKNPSDPSHIQVIP